MDLYKQVVSRDEPKARASGFIPICRSTPTVRPESLPNGTTSQECRGRPKPTTRARRKPFAPGLNLRLHHNQWATAEETFITPEMWDPCVNQSHHPSITDRSPLFVGIDVGIKHDNAARVAVKWDEQGEKLILVSHRIWKPTPNKPLDLENTVEQDLRDLNEQGDVVEYLADPYQMHRSISILQAAGLPIREFPQTPANITLMGQTRFDLLTGQNLEIYSSDELRQQALSTVTVDNPRRWRITKEKASKKIDAIVALAMACVAARSTAEERAAQSGASRFNREASSLPWRAGFVGQILVDVPATMLAQQSGDGSVRVLAAFASEGMGRW